MAFVEFTETEVNQIEADGHDAELALTALDNPRIALHIASYLSAESEDNDFCQHVFGLYAQYMFPKSDAQEIAAWNELARLWRADNANRS